MSSLTTSYKQLICNCLIIWYFRIKIITAWAVVSLFTFPCMLLVTTQDNYKSHRPGFPHLTLSISDIGLQSPLMVCSTVGPHRCSPVLGTIRGWNQFPMPAQMPDSESWCYVRYCSKPTSHLLSSIFSLHPNLLLTFLNSSIWKRKWTWRNQEYKQGNCWTLGSRPNFPIYLSFHTLAQDYQTSLFHSFFFPNEFLLKITFFLETFFFLTITASKHRKHIQNLKKARK